MSHDENTISWRGARVVADYGDPEAEYQALQTGCALVDRHERETYVGSGKDVVQLMQGLVTGDVYTLASPGTGMLTTLVNLKGRLVSDIRLLHILDVLLIDLEPGQTAAGVMTHIRHHVITEDAKFHDRRSTTGRLGVFGPKAAEVLSAVGRFERDLNTLPVYHGCVGRIGADEVVVQCVPTVGTRGFEMYLKDIASPRIERLILRHGGVLRCGQSAMERARIESGIPRFGVELDVDIIPLEADMNYAISYTKGCYLGQEIIARLDTRGVPAKMLRILEFSGPEVPEQDTPVIHDGIEVGKVRSAALSGDGRARAFAYLKRDHNTPGIEVEVGALRAQVRQVPGLLPEHF